MTPLFYEDSLGAKFVGAFDGPPSADDELIEDSTQLDAAQALANAKDPQAGYALVDADWIPVFGPSKISGLLDEAGWSASMITMPLDASGIAFVWDPYPPEQMPGAAMPAQHLADRPFALLVAPADAEAARLLLAGCAPGSASIIGVPAAYEREPRVAARRGSFALVMLVIFVGLDLLVLVLAFIADKLGWVH